MSFSPRRDATIAPTGVIVLVAVVMTTSCGSLGGPRPALELDVAQYMAHINQWAPAEREVSAAISRVFRSQFLDADLVISIADGVLPTIEEQLRATASYKPNTPEIRKIHARYTDAWQRLREGFDLISTGMKTDDGIRLAKGRRYLEAWSAEMIAVAKELRKLVQAVGISKTKTLTADLDMQGFAQDQTAKPEPVQTRGGGEIGEMSAP